MSTAAIVPIPGADPAGDIEAELSTVFKAMRDHVPSHTTRCTYWSNGRYCCC